MQELGHDSKYARYMFVVDGLLDEIIYESGAVSAENMAIMFAKFGRIIGWVGDGDSSQLPEEAAAFIQDKYPHLMPKALESA